MFNYHKMLNLVPTSIIYRCQPGSWAPCIIPELIYKIIPPIYVWHIVNVGSNVVQEIHLYTHIQEIWNIVEKWEHGGRKKRRSFDFFLISVLVSHDCWEQTYAPGHESPQTLQNNLHACVGWCENSLLRMTACTQVKLYAMLPYLCDGCNVSRSLRQVQKMETVA